MLKQLMRGGLLSNITSRLKYGKIATEGEAADIGGAILAIDRKNRCCTKSRAGELGCRVSGSYGNNQLVQKEDLSKAQTSIVIKFIIEYKNNLQECTLPEGVIRTSGTAKRPTAASMTVTGATSADVDSFIFKEPNQLEQATPVTRCNRGTYIVSGVTFTVKFKSLN